MLQPREESNLALKSLGRRGIADVGPEDLDGHQPFVPDISGEQHHRDPAVAELTLELVAVTEHFLKPVDENAHA